jgi:phage terminase large subunit
MQLKATKIFDKNHQALEGGARIIVNQGGRGSSKTWSIAQIFLILLLTKQNVVLTVARKYFPALRATAMKDFFTIMKNEGAYRIESHNRTEHIYRFRSNEIEFISVDQEQKVRGRKRDYLWMNEVNEFSLEDYRQLSMRTENTIFMDFNPSDEFHWIYDQILTRDDTTFIQSTYLDNPFLPRSIVKEIETYRTLDANYWRVYGLGERGISELKVYSHWKVGDEPETFDEVIYGLDFGYNNPTALVRIGIRDQAYYWKELLYESFITNTQLIERLKGLDIKNGRIYADTAEPQRIEEIRKAGFNIKPSNKDVQKGIDHIKSHAFYVTKDSVNLLKEVKSYSWKEKDGKALDEPVKQYDHLMDAGRYAVHTHSQKVEPSLYVV